MEVLTTLDSLERDLRCAGMLSGEGDSCLPEKVWVRASSMAVPPSVQTYVSEQVHLARAGGVVNMYPGTTDYYWTGVQTATKLL